jgi:hypothetical protein
MSYLNIFEINIIGKILKPIMMKSRIAFFTMLLAFIPAGIFAQQEQPVHYKQVGINFSSLNSFGLQFKTGSEKTLFRLSLLSMNLGQNSEWGRVHDSIDLKSQTAGAGIKLGFENRVPIYRKFDFIWGLEAGFNFNYQKQKNEIPHNDLEIIEWRLGPTLNVILGANYTISDHFVIGVEITPGIQYSFGKSKQTRYYQTTETTISNFGFLFNNNAASLSFAYRFGK